MANFLLEEVNWGLYTPGGGWTLFVSSLGFAFAVLVASALIARHEPVPVTKKWNSLLWRVPLYAMILNSCLSVFLQLSSAHNQGPFHVMIILSLLGSVLFLGGLSQTRASRRMN